MDVSKIITKNTANSNKISMMSGLACSDKVNSLETVVNFDTRMLECVLLNQLPVNSNFFF